MSANCLFQRLFFSSRSVMGFLFGAVAKEGLGEKEKGEKQNALKIQIGNRRKAERGGAYHMGASGIPEATGAGWDCSPSRGSTSGALFPWASQEESTHHRNWCPPPPGRGRGRNLRAGV